MESFVISVSLGTGCYRHIQISANATLYQLHKAILNAFDFDDDHQHAFFMDNRVWSPVDVYFSSKEKARDRLTKKYTLKQIALAKDRKFKYLFDFGDEWIFQCRVLREIEERTAVPSVIRSVGEAPEQYPEYDDEEDEGPLDCLSPEEMEQLYSQVPLRRDVIRNIRQYMSAAANLYGLLPMDELYALYNRQNPVVGEEQFFMAVAAIDFDSNNFSIIDSTNPHVSEEHPLNSCELAADYLFIEDPEGEIRELRRAQKGKPLKILPKEEFLRYADSTYFPETPQRKAMIAFLRPLSSGLPLSAAEYCGCIQSVIVIDAPIQEILTLMIDEGLTRKKQWDLAKFAALFQELNNNTHKHANRGYTPDELFRMREQGWAARKVPAGQLTLFEDIRAPQTCAGAPKGDAPCPCGSGKKYKNCCGKR